jgi:hypothetical protein
MEIIIGIIMLLVSFSVLLKLTYLPGWGRTVVSLVLAMFVGFSWDFAANQSKTQIAEWIYNPGLMLDIAVILTVDVILQIAFCITSSGLVSGERLSRSTAIIHAVCKWIPGILIFPVLLASLVEVIFSFPGFDFAIVAWILASVIFIISIATPYLIKIILPEKDIRLELIFMGNALIASLGIVATVNGRTSVTGTNSIDMETLGGVLSLFIVGASIGYILFKRKQNKLINNIK